MDPGNDNYVSFKCFAFVFYSVSLAIWLASISILFLTLNLLITTIIEPWLGVVGYDDFIQDALKRGWYLWPQRTFNEYSLKKLLQEISVLNGTGR